MVAQQALLFTVPSLQLLSCFSLLFGEQISPPTKQQLCNKISTLGLISSLPLFARWPTSFYKNTVSSPTLTLEGICGSLNFGINTEWDAMIKGQGHRAGCGTTPL